jgi:hypothetical protein
MSEAYLTNWTFGSESPDTRNRFHQIALHEARIASDHRRIEPASPVKGSLFSRVRLAFARPSAGDTCNCPA